MRTANSASAAASTTSSALTGLSDALTDNGDIQTAINQFFLDVGTLASNPTSAAQQQTVISDGQTIAGSFQSAAGSITDTMAGATSALQENVGEANSLLGQLATINGELATSPNDPSLIDLQELALNSLSGVLSVNVTPSGTGGQVLISTGGTMLLIQAGAQTLAVAGGTDGSPPVVTAGAAATPLALSGNDGTIGGNLQAWQSGATALQGVNTLAVLFASAVNTSQAQGLTTTGAQGGDLFSVPAPSVTAGTANAGTGVLTAQLTNASALPSDGGPFLLSYNGSSGWSAVDQSTNQSYNLGTGTNLSFAGMAITVSGNPASGDTFLLNPAPGAAASMSVTTSQGSAIASADPYVATPGALQGDGSILDDNAGSIVAGSDSVTNTPAPGAAVVPASYYGQPLQVTFTSATGYNVETTTTPATTIASGSLPDGNVAIAYPADGAASGTYWQLPISGTPAAGDVLTLMPGGSGSGSNATRMADLWAAPGTTAGGTLQQTVIGFGSQLGTNAQQAQQQASVTSAQLTTATSNLQSIAGVSSDQQAVLLTQYSQAYQAAAQVVSSANTMFTSLLQAVDA